MPEHFQLLWDKILSWTNLYGYHAVVPTLLVDPAGVPWAWIILLLIAEEARLSIPLMLGYGVFVLSAWDHGLYWAARLGGRPMLDRLALRWPKIAQAIAGAEKALSGKGIWGVTFGRYLPFVGRWIAAGAGLAKVSYGRFIFFDAIGVALTVVGFGIAAHLVGRSVVEQPWFPQALVLTFIISTVVTAVITFWQAWLVKKKKARHQQEPAE